jgi:hypothetical protein
MCKHGDPLQTLVGDAATRFLAKVDVIHATWPDNHWLWTAGVLPSGYGTFWTGTRKTYAHRVAYELFVRPIPDDLLIDHDYRCPKNCCNPDHLRIATQKQNQENRAGAMATSKSGVRGVCWDASKSLWKAQVCHNGITWARRYPTLDEAEAAVIAKRNELYTHNDVDRNTAW